jgi:AraC-like DNA-binding protein/ligand-binding sensor protein
VLKIETENNIRGREIEPLLSKSGSILTAYEQAADCVVQAVDSEGYTFNPQKTGPAGLFCSCLGKNTADHETGVPPEDFSCGAIHREAIEESRRLGSSYIYMCPLGLVFWISPLYSGGRYAGALVAGKVLGIEKEEACGKLQACGCGGLIKDDLEGIPRKNYEEIKALAQMMLICAQQISAGRPGGKAADRESGGEIMAGNYGPGKPGSGNFISGEPSLAPNAASLTLVSSAPAAASAAALAATVAKTPGEGSSESSALAAAGSPAKATGESAQPSSSERLLIAALRRGDSAAAKRILENILDILNTICPGDLRFFRCRAIELVVLLSRSCAVEKETEALLEENNLYLKRIADSLTIEELSSNLHRIVERMAGRIFSFQGLRHASALRRAERFIWKNYTRKVSLDEIAAASGLSAPYFSTIFREEMGEYLSAHLNRLRVEKACTMLIETNMTLNNISESCGFEDQSWFSKIFKSYTGYSPGKYREQGGIDVYPQDKSRAV